MKRILFLGVMLIVTTISFGQVHDYDNEGIIFSHPNNAVTIGSSTIQVPGFINNQGSENISHVEITGAEAAFLRLGATNTNSSLFFMAGENTTGHQINTLPGIELSINNVMRLEREYVTINTSYIPTDYVVAVGGDIIAEGVRVELETNWPDYVFTSTYNLMPLAQVEQFIEENGHLPNVPSAQTMEEEGIDLGDMVTKQMEKIEELTLYIIELQKEVEVLKAQK